MIISSDTTLRYVETMLAMQEKEQKRKKKRGRKLRIMHIIKLRQYFSKLNELYLVLIIYRIERYVTFEMSNSVFFSLS